MKPRPTKVLEIKFTKRNTTRSSKLVLVSIISLLFRYCVISCVLLSSVDQKLLEPVCTYCKKPLFTVGTYLFSIDSIGNGISLLEIQYILLEVKHDYNKSYPFWSMFPTESAFSRYLFLCFQIFLLFSGTNFNKSYWNFSSHYWKTLSFNMGLLNSSSPLPWIQ